MDLFLHVNTEQLSKPAFLFRIAYFALGSFSYLQLFFPCRPTILYAGVDMAVQYFSSNCVVGGPPVKIGLPHFGPCLHGDNTVQYDDSSLRILSVFKDLGQTNPNMTLVPDTTVSTKH